MTSRKFKVGETAIWTDYNNGFRYRARILGHVEPDADDGYDEDAHGPLYRVDATGTDKLQVAEEDLAPWPDDGAPDDVIDGPGPRDPVTAWDTEQATKAAGGQIIGTIHRGGSSSQARITVGAYEHPHHMQSLNSVTIRVYDDDGPAGVINLGPDETLNMIKWLHDAGHICWGGSHDDPNFTPHADFD
jgi:hypothetical protein